MAWTLAVASFVSAIQVPQQLPRSTDAGQCIGRYYRGEIPGFQILDQQLVRL